MGRLVMALLALAACSRTTWREIEIKHAEPQQQVFVVTKGNALVFDVESTTTDTLQGTPVRAWSIPPAPLSVRETESPEQLAHRLGWRQSLPDRAPRSVRISDVLYATARRSGPQPVLQALPFVAVVAVVVFLGATLIAAPHAN